jgi:fatty acid desaturase
MTMTRRELLTAPRVAWPTLVVLACALGTWMLGFALGVTRTGPAAVAFMLAAAGAYAAFTPIHEAAHRSIARAPWVSALAGRLASIPLLGPFPAVRYFHLEHHKHTNDPDLDPDHWSGRGPSWVLPLRWTTQDLRYYALYVGRSRRPTHERIEVYATAFVLVLAIAAACAVGHGRDVLLFWVLPARAAIFLLAFAFDWLPHHPHSVTSKQDRFRATRVIEGRILHALFFGQSLHLVHHLYPGVPFYRYARVWRSGLCHSTRA